MTTSTLTRRVGQRVLISGGRFHGAATITKINPKNIVVTLESTGGRVNAHPSFLSDLAKDAPVPSSFATVMSVDLPTQQPGALVQVTGKQGLFVVLADKFDKINVAALGGDGGRYWRIPRAGIKPVALDTLSITVKG